MIIGIGNDLVAVERVAKACEKEGFLKISVLNIHPLLDYSRKKS